MARTNPPKRRSTIYLVLGVVCWVIASVVFGIGFSTTKEPPPESAWPLIRAAFATFGLLTLVFLVIGIAIRRRENRDHMES